MGLGKFFLVVVVILIAIYLISPTVFQSGYSQVQNLFKNWNITLPIIPYQSNITNTSLGKASSTGQVYVYLGATSDSNFTQEELDRFVVSFKKYINQASYGYLDNINFITEANANQNNPRVNVFEIGSKIKGAYYFSKEYPIDAQNFWLSKNSNISWIFSSALMKSNFPFAWTTIISGDLDKGGCSETFNFSTHDLCRETAHELAHAIFACDDNTGDIMRCTTEYPCTYPGHFPPACLNLIKSYMPQLVSK